MMALLLRARLLCALFGSAWSIVACGSADFGTGVGNPGTASIARAAATVLLSGSTAANLARALAGKSSACTGAQLECFCTEVASGGFFPAAVSAQSFGNAGSFGAATAAATLTIDDYCTSADGTPNAIAGSDGFGRYATFTLTAPLAATCTSSAGSAAVTFAADSNGVFRNIDEADLSIRHEIFATFYVTTDAATTATHCSLRMDAANRITSAICTDADGAAITQDVDVNCTSP